MRQSIADRPHERRMRQDSSACQGRKWKPGFHVRAFLSPKAFAGFSPKRFDKVAPSTTEAPMSKQGQTGESGEPIQGWRRRTPRPPLLDRPRKPGQHHSASSGWPLRGDGWSPGRPKGLDGWFIDAEIASELIEKIEQRKPSAPDRLRASAKRSKRYPSCCIFASNEESIHALHSPFRLSRQA